MTEEIKPEAHLIPEIPGKFFTLATLRTLAGSAGAVWAICLVISSILPENYLTYIHWRIIALFFSQLIVIILFIRTKKKDAAKWMITILNGCLVFIYASGMNAVSTGIAFKKNKELNQASLLPFTKEIAWWPDKQLLENIQPRTPVSESDTAISKVEFQKMLTTIKNCDSTGTTDTCFQHLQTLNSEIKVLQYQIDSIGKAPKLIFSLISDNNTTKIGGTDGIDANGNYNIHITKALRIKEIKEVIYTIQNKANPTNSVTINVSNPKNGFEVTNLKIDPRLAASTVHLVIIYQNNDMVRREFK